LSLELILRKFREPCAIIKQLRPHGSEAGGAQPGPEPGDRRRDKSLENYPFIWGAVYDGDLIYASDINQGIYVLDLLGD
jgi:hypothetical protein